MNVCRQFDMHACTAFCFEEKKSRVHELGAGIPRTVQYEYDLQC